MPLDSLTQPQTQITADQAHNLARNGSFEEWPASGPPSGWALAGAGASVAKDTVNVHLGSASAAVTRAGTDAKLTQDAAVQAGGLAFLRGKTYTVAVFARKPAGGRARVGLYDGVGQSLSGFACHTDEWERIPVTRTIELNATKLEISLEVIDVNGTVQFDGVMLVEGLDTPGFQPNPADTQDPTVSDTTAPSVPTGLALSPGSNILNDGTFEAFIVATWTANPEGDVEGYRLRIKKTTDGANDWTVFSTNKVTTLVFRGLQPNIAYEVQISAFDFAGNPSAFSLSATTTTAANPGAPATPTGFTATPFPLAVALTWNPNAERDIAYYELQRADDSGFATNLVTRQIDGTAYVDKTQDTVSRFYRIRAVRRSRGTDGASLVASPFTTAIQAAGLLIGTAVLEALAVTDAKLADLSVLTTKLANLAVTSAKLGDLAVLTAKLDALAVTTAKLADGAVTSLKIGDFEVATADLADASVTTVKVGALQITTGTLADGSVTTVKLGDLQITTAKIADAAITTLKMGDFSVTAVKFGAVIAGGNEAKNSSMEVDSDGDGMSDFWGLYNNGPESATFSRPAAPYHGGFAQRVTWTATNTSTKGILAPSAGIINWKANKTYVVSWYAKATAAIATGMQLAWNVGPATTVTLLNPNLSTTYQRYAFRITWGASVDPQIFITITNLFAAAANDLDIDAVHIEEGEVLTGYAPKPDEILAGQVGSAELANASVTTVKLGDLQITTAKLADGSVTTLKIGDLEIATADLADGAITSVKIGALQITTAKLADGSITSLKIGDLEVATVDMADGSVTTVKVGNAQITNALMANAAINTAQIVDAAITTLKVADANIVTAKIGDLNVTTLKIAGLAVSTEKLAADAVTASTLFSNDASASFGTTETEIGTVTVSTNGGVCQVLGMAVVLRNASTPDVADIDIRIRKDSITGTVLAAGQIRLSDINPNDLETVTVMGLDSSPAASQTYKLTAVASQGGSTNDAAQRKLFAVNYKK